MKPLFIVSPLEYVWLRSIPYKNYLNTTHWHRVKALLLEEAGHQCGRCGSVERLQVHHKTYEHLGSEDIYPEDVEVLCRECHAAHHGVAA